MRNSFTSARTWGARAFYEKYVPLYLAPIQSPHRSYIQCTVPSSLQSSVQNSSADLVYQRNTQNWWKCTQQQEQLSDLNSNCFLQDRFWTGMACYSPMNLYPEVKASLKHYSSSILNIQCILLSKLRTALPRTRPRSHTNFLAASRRKATQVILEFANVANCFAHVIFERNSGASCTVITTRFLNNRHSFNRVKTTAMKRDWFSLSSVLECDRVWRTEWPCA